MYPSTLAFAAARGCRNHRHHTCNTGVKRSQALSLTSLHAQKARCLLTRWPPSVRSWSSHQWQTGFVIISYWRSLPGSNTGTALLTVAYKQIRIVISSNDGIHHGVSDRHMVLLR